MKKAKIFGTLSLMATLALTLPTQSYAAISVTKIGTVTPSTEPCDVNNSEYSITSSDSVTITGTGNPGAVFNQKLNSSSTGTKETTSAVTVDSAGTWSVILTNLSQYNDGSTVNLTFQLYNATDTCTFNLLGPSISTTTTKGGETLPETGAVENTILLLGGGILTVLAGLKLSKSFNKA